MKFKETFIYKLAKTLLKERPYLSDKKQIELVYKQRFGKNIDLENPKSFNEKNNWRKLYERNDLYTRMVDKYEIKKVIEENCGKQHTFKLLDSWDKAEDIDISNLPDKFVLKCNHAGGVIVCRDKSTFDLDGAKEELGKTLKENYFLKNREWPYKNVKRKIIAEEFMGENLTDYKNYCFNGKMTYTLVWKNVSRQDGRKPDPFFCGAYDRDWKKTDLKLGYPSLEDDVTEKPECYDQLVEVVESMAKDIPFVRVDCYIIDNKVYVGETTFFPWGGFQIFKDEKWNLKLGEMIKLKEKRC